MAPFMFTNMKGVKLEPQTPYNPNGWKKCKKEFITFVKYYNVEKTNLKLNVEENEALQGLHKMWKYATTPADSQIEYYDEMNPFHKILQEKFENNTVWKPYMDTVKAWRMECLQSNMMMCNIPMKPMEHNSD